MGKVILDVSMSLDGFIAGPNDEIEPLHDWVFKDKDPRNAQLQADAPAQTGAVIMGKRTFNLIDSPDGWGAPDGTHFQLPVFVLTHEARETVTKGVTTFTFVTDGIAAAIARAQAAAGSKNVGIMGAQTAQQCIAAGLLDEMQLHIVPVLFGQGIRLFDHLGSAQIELKKRQVIESPPVTHLRYQVAKYKVET